VEAALTALPIAPPESDPTRWPYLEVRVIVDGPRPSLRREVESLVKDKAVRLVKLQAIRQGEGHALAYTSPSVELSQLGAHEVLGRKWVSNYGLEPPAPVLACFHELIDEVNQADGGGR
jgi:exonuclease SbcD